MSMRRSLRRMRPLMIVWLVVLPLAVAGLIAVTLGPSPAMIGLTAVVVLAVVAPIPKMRELIRLAGESRRLKAEARQLQAEKAAIEAEMHVAQEQLRLMREHPELFGPQEPA